MLCSTSSKNPLVIRNSDLAVVPPRPLPLTLKAKRSFAKLTKFSILATICAFCGYAYRDTDIRSAVDYRVTLLTTPGVSNVSPTLANHSASFEPLPHVPGRSLLATKKARARINSLLH